MWFESTRRIGMSANRTNAVIVPVRPEHAERWSMASLRAQPIKIGTKIVSHGRYATLQLAEVAGQRELIGKVLSLMDGLRPAPLPP